MSDRVLPGALWQSAKRTRRSKYGTIEKFQAQDWNSEGPDVSVIDSSCVMLTPGTVVCQLTTGVNPSLTSGFPKLPCPKLPCPPGKYEPQTLSHSTRPHLGYPPHGGKEGRKRPCRPNLTYFTTYTIYPIQAHPNPRNSAVPISRSKRGGVRRRPSWS